jgi:hypothetical protein
MPRTATILVLCANKRSVESYKALKIIQEFCANTDVPGCKYWEKIDIYYAGLNLLDTTRMPNTTFDEQGNREITPWGMKIPRNSNLGVIPVTHQLLPNELGDLKSNMLPEIFPKAFDIIINENCPRSQAPGTPFITPAILTNLINGCLKLDGYYIDKADAQGQFGPRGFQVIYDPNNTKSGLLEKINPEFKVDTEISIGTMWVAYKLKTQSEKEKMSKATQDFLRRTGRMPQSDEEVRAELARAEGITRHKKNKHKKRNKKTNKKTNKKKYHKKRSIKRKRKN